VDWSINESEDHKVAVVKDGDEELFRVSEVEARPGDVEVTFSKGKNISEEAALVAIMSCKQPIQLDSTNVTDMKVIASVAAKVNEGTADKVDIRLSERAKAVIEQYFKQHPDERSDEKFQALNAMMSDRHSPSSSASPPPEITPPTS